MADKEEDNNNQKIVTQFKDIATDLFNIEVNTILDKHISAQKMPSLRHALIDIGQEYYATLTEIGLTDEEAESEELRKLEEIEATNIYGSFYAFDAYRTRAKQLIEDRKKRLLNEPESKDFLTPEQISILPRIKDNSDLLKGLFSALCSRDQVLNPKLENQCKAIPEEDFSPNMLINESVKIDEDHTKSLINAYTRIDLINGIDLISGIEIPTLPLNEYEIILVRKLWEVGTEVIVMQTIVQVDGDVISRLNPIILEDETYPKLQEYHQTGINIALDHWAGLVSVAKELVMAAGRGISGMLSK
jgi:hypothetical protein